MNFEGKVVLITGGSRGIGRACVQDFARRGAIVTFVYQQNHQAAEELKSALCGEGRSVTAYQADVRDAVRAREIVELVVQNHGRIDVLVNSAGIIRDGLLASMTDQMWQEVLETNLTGTFNYCRAVSQQMMYQRSGVIVNVSSTAAEFASRGQVNYAASKGGIEALTRALAKELAPRNIRVNAVAPGMIETDMSKAVRGLVGDRLRELIPLRRIGMPEEVSEVILFLASDHARYITGQVLRVDGGLSLGGY